MGTPREIIDSFVARYKDDYPGFTALLEIDSRRGRVPFRLSPIQRKYHAARTARDVVLKARRVGMTTEALARDLWHFLTQDTPAVVILCQSGKDHQGATSVRRILDLFIDSLIRRGLPLTFSKRTTTQLELDCRAGSLDIIEAGASEKAASKTGRAGRITRLHATEMAFWEYGGETWTAVRYCVAGAEFGTEVQIESTANGGGWESAGSPKDATGAELFYWAVRDAKRGTTGYRLHFFAWFEDPDNELPVGPDEYIEPRNARERHLVRLGVTPGQLKWYQKQLDETKSQDQLDQELASDDESCFLVSGRTFFDKVRLGEMLTETSEPQIVQHIRASGAYGSIVGGVEIPAIRVWSAPVSRRSYVVSLDTSEGEDGDASAGIVYDAQSGEHMATLWGQFKPWELARYGAGLAKRYNNALIVVERNNDGKTTLRALEAEQKYANVFVDLDEKPGWLNTEPMRASALKTFEKAVRDKHFVTRDRFLVSELRTFVVKAKGRKHPRVEASGGNHDDLVLAAAIGWDVICRPRQQTQEDTEFVA